MNFRFLAKFPSFRIYQDLRGGRGKGGGLVIYAQRRAHASFNEVFLSVLSFLLPIIKAHGTEYSPAGKSFFNDALVIYDYM